MDAGIRRLLFFSVIVVIGAREDAAIAVRPRRVVVLVRREYDTVGAQIVEKLRGQRDQACLRGYCAISKAGVRRAPTSAWVHTYLGCQRW